MRAPWRAATWRVASADPPSATITSRAMSAPAMACRGRPRLSAASSVGITMLSTAARFLPSGLYQLNYTHTIAFPVSSAGGEVQAMRGYRQAFPTPRGDGKCDRMVREIVQGSTWLRCMHTTPRARTARTPRERPNVLELF